MINNTQDLSKSSILWPKIRLSLLGLTLVGILGVLFKLIWFPAEDKKLSTTDFVFPQTVPLSNWEQQETRKLRLIPKKENGLRPGFDPGQLYKYVKDKDALEVEARYAKYHGNINSHLIVYRQLPPATISPKIKYLKDTGYYGVFTHKNQAFLSACVNPKGQSTATEQQFTKNRYLNSWSIQRTFLWLIGQEDLFDGRCLWTLMSVPISNYDPYLLVLEKDLEDEYQKLETAWVEWYRWWKNNLPSY
ncbi:conserved hypothetical protein [Gloeothece citriformis PCC 7424]|uniref:Cyanoexosortase A system-associated protein n=1 Tax=Gloeothece citriformis (strain PCC 7424) TaxID=65393 RepID=B7KIE5_GLOC7|nr:cyanoexosortase A system-associated protein [Gloeothece citriformis]ACK73632.1 conserved hypothetical protein [Gloeothece citriformis PCC 7424]